MVDFGAKRKFCRLIEKKVSDFNHIKSVEAYAFDAKWKEFLIGEPGWEEKVDKTCFILSYDDEDQKAVVSIIREVEGEVWIPYVHQLTTEFVYRPYKMTDVDECINEMEKELGISFGDLPRLNFLVGVLKREVDDKWRERFAEVLEYLPFWMEFSGFKLSGKVLMLNFLCSDDTAFSINRKLEQWFDGMKFAKEVITS